MKTFFPLPNWLKTYPKAHLNQDILAGLIVGVIVIPQSLGYAMLSGLPPVYGLYSAIVPVLVYAWVGSSSVNAVGPVAITAIMTAQALAPFGNLPPDDYARLASLLALMTGTFLWLASWFRLGWITQFISRGVTAGFISGASILIFIGQIKFITNIPITGNTVLANGISFVRHLSDIHLPTLMVGGLAFLLLFGNRYYLAKILPPKYQFFSKLMPLMVMIVAIIVSHFWQFDNLQIKIIGDIPQGLPQFVLPFSTSFLPMIFQLLPASALMALVAFVSSDAVASSFARKRQEIFYSNQELKGLGLANIIGAFFQSFTVVGGFSRTAVNVDAGAISPLASVLSVVVMAVCVLWFAPYLAPLPYAVLGANIMVAIVSLIDMTTFKKALVSDRLDALAFAVALIGVLVFGLNIGLVVGILVSFAGLIWQSSRPHIAIVGQVGNTGHFRNIHRHQVNIDERLLIIRIDESLFYGNAGSVRDFIGKAVQSRANCQNVVLMLSAVNHIDLTGQEMLITLNQELAQQNITLHLSEVKGPVMDLLQKTDVINTLSGKVFLSTVEAVDKLV